MRGVPAVLAVVLLAGCTQAHSSDSGASTSSASTPGASTPPAFTATATTAAPIKVTKVLTFIEENHSLSQMQNGMPYAYGLAKKYGYATHYAAIRHPSLPDYLAIAGGSTFGVTDDAPPSSHKIHGRSIFGRAITSGKTAGAYVGSMSTNCKLTDSGPYAVKHNPWAYFADADERSWCNKYDRPVGDLTKAAAAGNLPNVGMVIPNLNQDAHDGSLATADAWFKGQMVAVLAGSDWKSGRLAIVLTADEDNRFAGNRVLTVVIHRSQHGHIVATGLTHYSLTRLYASVTHTTPLRNAVSAPSMAAAFGLPVN